MPGKCPECGGIMRTENKLKICETCGLSISVAEYDRWWDRIKGERYTEDDEKAKQRKEYLKWYESKKEK
jgi:hypothetical protein